MVEAIAISLEAIANRMEAIASRLESIALLLSLPMPQSPCRHQSFQSESRRLATFCWEDCGEVLAQWTQLGCFLDNYMSMYCY